MSSSHPVNIQQVNNITVTNNRDVLAIEEPLEIQLKWQSEGKMQQKSISITMRTPGHDEDLAIGFLLTEGILRSIDQVAAISRPNFPPDPVSQANRILVELAADTTVDLVKLDRHFYTSSSCGVCGKSSIDAVYNVGIPPLKKGVPIFNRRLIHKLPFLLRQQQAVFDETGGLHAAALFDRQGHLLFLREDVGRHNAVDKLVGAAFRQNLLPLSESLILVSGRASFELIQKALMGGIPILAAVGAPSSLAIQLAEQSGMTVLGFVRSQRYNIYCGEERIG